MKIERLQKGHKKMLANSRWRAGWAPARVIVKKLRHRDERGVTLVEYALLLALIAVVAVGSLVLLGNTVNNTLTRVADQTVSLGNADDIIKVNAGSPQSTTVSTPFPAPLQVIVTNSGGTPVQGITITFSAPATGASGTFANNTFSTTAVTNAAGLATSSTFTANATGGAYGVTASSLGITSKATFQLKNDSTTDTYTLSACAGNNQSVPVTQAFSPNFGVTVSDTTSQPVNGLTVTFTAPGSGASGTFANNTNTTQTTTNGSGTATATTYTANKVAGKNYSVAVNVYVGSATVANLVASATCTETNLPGAPIVTVVAGNNQSADTTFAFAANLEVLVADQYGNPYATDTVTFAAPGSGASGTFAAPCAGATCNVQTNAAGYATAPTFTANNTAGTYAVQASAPTATNTSFTETNLSFAGAHYITVTGGNSQSAVVSTAFAAPLQVQVTTLPFGLGNPVAGVNVTFSAPTSGATGTFGGGAGCNSSTCTVVTDANGYATTATFTANGTVGSNYTVTVTATGAASTTLTETNLATTGNDTMTIVSGNNQSAQIGNQFAQNLEVNISNGANPVQGVTVTFTAPATGPGGGFYYGFAQTENQQTDGSGDATSTAFDANQTAGTYTVLATAPGVPSVAFTLTNTDDNLTITGGNNQSAFTGSAFANPLQVQLTNAGGFGVNGVNVTFTVVPVGGASATFGGSCGNSTTCVVATAGNGFNRGYATAPTLTAGSTGGTYTITASANDAPTVTFTETNAGYQLTMVAGNNQTAAINTAFGSALVVKATTSGGAVDPGVVVTFTAPTNGASGTFGGTCNNSTTCAVTTDSNGLATAPTFTANGTADFFPGGTYNVTANAPAALAPVTFTESNADYTINIVQGSPQTGSINTAFGTALEVQVVNQFGIAVGGASVTFSAPGSGASGTFGGTCNSATCVVTTSNGFNAGYATAPTFTANGTTGSYAVTVSTPGAPTNTTFNLTNANYTLLAVNGNNQTTGVDAPFATKLEVQVLNGGTPVQGASVTFSAPANGASGTFGGACGDNNTCTVTTDAGGDATAPTYTANGTAGANYPVTITAAGAPTSLTYTETNEAYTLAITGGNNQTALVNTAFANPLSVQVQLGGVDAGAGVQVTFTAPNGFGGNPSGTFGGTCNDRTCTVLTNPSGVATSPTFTANGNTGPAYNVSASGPGGTGTVNFSETNEDYVLTITGNGNNQTALPNTAFANPLAVQVSLGGTPVGAGVQVTFTAPNGFGGNPSGTFGGTCNNRTCTVLTNASGVATSPTFTANGNTGPAYNVSASGPGGSGTVNFTETNANYTLAIVSGSPQSATHGKAFTNPLVVQVQLGGVNVGTGVNVTFTAPANGASGTFGGVCNNNRTCTIATAANGQATSPTFTANGTAGGPYNVSATAAPASNTVNFRLTNN